MRPDGSLLSQGPAGAPVPWSGRGPACRGWCAAGSWQSPGRAAGAGPAGSLRPAAAGRPWPGLAAACRMRTPRPRAPAALRPDATIAVRPPACWLLAMQACLEKRGQMGEYGRWLEGPPATREKQRTAAEAARPSRLLELSMAAGLASGTGCSPHDLILPPAPLSNKPAHPETADERQKPES